MMYLQTDLSLIPRKELENFVKEAVKRYPSLVDILPKTVNGNEHFDIHAEQNKDGNVEPNTGNDKPKWCKCGNCRPMRYPEEHVCCRKKIGQCIVVLEERSFRNVVLDREVLENVIETINNEYGFEDAPNNKNLRHAAYKQFILSKHGRVGAGNRLVVPSCCVWRIRMEYPSPTGIYTGFRRN